MAILIVEHMCSINEFPLLLIGKICHSSLDRLVLVVAVVGSV